MTALSLIQIVAGAMVAVALLTVLAWLLRTWYLDHAERRLRVHGVSRRGPGSADRAAAALRGGGRHLAATADALYRGSRGTPSVHPGHRDVIPIGDDNPTLRTPIVTYVIVGLILASWILLQGAGFNQMSLVASVCNLGLVPGEITKLARLGEGIPIAPGATSAGVAAGTGRWKAGDRRGGAGARCRSSRTGSRTRRGRPG
mgnify:CR=1 FL=1